MSDDVYFYEAFEEETEALRRHLPDGLSAGFTWRTIQEAGHDGPPAKIISTRTQSAFPGAWAERLDAILTRSTGYDHVRDYLRRTGRDIPAGYLPLYCSRAVAEQAMLLWAALLRKLPRQVAQFPRFKRDGLTGRECRGRTLLVVGVGNIGHEVVRVGRGLEMNVLGVDIDPRHADVQYTSIEEGLAAADVIVCAMNLTDENAGYFDRRCLGAARTGAIFVNVARGELAPAANLLELVDSGRLGGVGLDVYEAENELAVSLRSGVAPADGPAAASLQLAARPNVIATPHNAFNTVEAIEQKARQSMESIVEFIKTGAFPSPVPL